MYGLSGAGWAAPPDAPAAASARALTFTADGDATGAARLVPVYFDKRLTIVMPGPVRMAVPGSPDVLVAHVKDNVVVVTLVDSPYVRQTRPATNLTIIGRDDLAFACRVTVAADAGDAPDLVRVTRGAALARKAGVEAAEVIRAWLAEGDAGVTPDTAAVLAPLAGQLDERARHQLAGWAAAGPLQPAPVEAARTKREFIYLTIERGVRLGAQVLVRATVTNHSQPPLTVGAVRLLGPDGAPRDGVLWRMADPQVAADGAPRGVGLLAPAAAFADPAPQLEVCERGGRGRCVRLAVR